jgi:hypothetical protein
MARDITARPNVIGDVVDSWLNDEGPNGADRTIATSNPRLADMMDDRSNE